MRLHGKTRNAVLETIRICKDKNVLKQYLLEREKEVIDIMMALFDQQKAVEQFGYEMKEEGRAEGHREGRAEGHREGRAEGHREGRAEGKLEGKKEAAINMKAEGMTESMIAKILDVGLNIVQEWLAGTVVAR